MPKVPTALSRESEDTGKGPGSVYIYIPSSIFRAKKNPRED